MQAFTIPANRLTGGDMWQIVMQRDSAEGTYPDDVLLRMIWLTYGTPCDPGPGWSPQPGPHSPCAHGCTECTHRRGSSGATRHRLA